MCICMYIYIYMYACICICICIYINVYVCVYLIDIHTHILIKKNNIAQLLVPQWCSSADYATSIYIYIHIHTHTSHCLSYIVAWHCNITYDMHYSTV